jgi:hypothetical protein
VDGPHFGGWEIYHVNGSPADPDRLYASQSNEWFGQVIQRSDDGGRTWEPAGNEFAYAGVDGLDVAGVLGGFRQRGPLLPGHALLAFDHEVDAHASLLRSGIPLASKSASVGSVRHQALT